MARRRPLMRFATLWVVAFAAQMLLWFPWHPQVLKTGLDSSYEYALNELFVHRVSFVDSVHPYGPYGFLKNDVYHPDTFGLLLGSRLVLFAVFALVAARIASRWAPTVRAGALWILLLVVVTRRGEPYVVSLAMLVFLVFWDAVSTADRARWSPVVLALSVAALMQFTYAAIIAGLVALMLVTVAIELAVGWPRERTVGAGERLAVAMAWPALFAAGLLMAWVTAGQTVGDLPSYIAGRMALSDSFNERAALAGPTYQVVAFAAGGAVLWTVFTWRELRRSGARALAPAAALGLWLALAAKHSFVRHDAPHAAYGAFSALCMAAIFGLAMLRREDPLRRADRRAPAVAAITAMALAGLLLLTYDREHAYGARFFRHLDLRTTAERVARFVREPSHIRQRHDRALARIRRDHPLPPIRGTVDVYPWELSLAFAHGLALDPRPSLQSHMAGYGDVDAANARHLAAPDGPANVLLRVESLDHRYPSTMDGLSWPILLGDFRLRSGRGSHLVLSRSPGARVLGWGEPTHRTVTFGERVEVPHSPNRLLWMRVEMARRSAGRLVATAYRGPILYLRVEPLRGGERWFRMVPGSAAGGFLLSPLIASNADFRSLLDGSWQSLLAPAHIEAITLFTEFGAGWYWQDDVRLELQEISLRPTDR